MAVNERDEPGVVLVLSIFFLKLKQFLPYLKFLMNSILHAYIDPIFTVNSIMKHVIDENSQKYTQTRSDTSGFRF